MSGMGIATIIMLALSSPAKPLVLELRDNRVPGEWAPQVDYELAVSWKRISIAANHHALARNLPEAQVVASVTLEW